MTALNDASPMTAHYGYSDEQLERLSSLQHGRESGIAPWATWESENYGFGKTFRAWANFPAILPLYFSSDHGVHWESRCWPNETDNRFRVFFSWNRKKSDTMRREHGKLAYHVPHPWIHYRKKNYPELPASRKGTLVFYAHSNQTTTPVYEDLDQYIDDLRELPDKYQPVVICLMAHDINKGLHKSLRKYDIPMVTAGIGRSQQFVDRFYTLIRQFSFASSANLGSHSFYIIEAGIPFFLFGAYPKYMMKGAKFVEDGAQDLGDYGDSEDIAGLTELKELLATPVDEVTPEQHQAVSRYLGLDSKMTRGRASMIFWRELILHLDELFISYFRMIFRKVLKLKLLSHGRAK